MKKNLLFTILCGFQIFAIAQLDCSQVQYEHSTFTDTYEDIDTTLATSLTQGIVWDDPNVVFPLEFDFEFYSLTTSSLLVSGDLLGSAVIGNPDALKSSANVFLPAYADYTDLAYAEFEEGSENGISTISYITVGDEGNRIMKLQWKDVGFYEEVSEGTANNFMNIQMWLYEVDKSIEFRYGPSAIAEEDIPLLFGEISSPISGLICDINLNDNAITGVYLTGDPTSPALENLEEEPSAAFNSIPEAGRVFRFERSTISEVPAFTEPLDVTIVTKENEILVSNSQELEKVEILDLTGKVVLTSLEKKSDYSFDTTGLYYGMYLVRVYRNGESHTRKVIKQ